MLPDGGAIVALESLRQGAVVRTEPSRRAAAIVGASITILACVFLLWLQPTGEQVWGSSVSSDEAEQILLFTVLFGCLVMYLSLASSLVNGRRWLLARGVVRVARETRLLRPPGPRQSGPRASRSS